MTTHQHLVDPFHIHVPDADLDDLRRRLRTTRLPAPLPGDGWDSGVPVSVLETLVERWAAHDWRATEERWNRWPQVRTRIDGQTIHAVHVRSEVPGALPLLLVHGWPGSFLELEQVIGPLTDPEAHGGRAEDAFHVVVPSLPGFGFSTPLEEAGWPTDRIARAFVTLMDRLGHGRFAVQGGDIGAVVAPEVGRVAPDRVVGVHVNGALGPFVSEVGDQAAATLSALEQDRLDRVRTFQREELGYIALQSTRPSLVGVMAADSPVAQLAWILDKLQAWSHPAPAPAVDVLGEEFVLANASLYWLTASAGSAAYVGYAQGGAWGAEQPVSGVPTAALQLAHDVGLRFAAERENHVVRWTDVEDRGGHFAALEEPGLLVDDVRAFLRPLRP
ncbi:epoxide hydrolase family protein [Nocardioides sp. CPCC 205120]|uniref:epoxide hydrolase family protein n=1 Tax=Nocardioides sp. CPCC 205120 TaxID=3406462 RepID=UPI003B51179C